MARPPRRPTRRKSVLTQSVSFGIPLVIAVALPVIVYVTYTPAATNQPRFLQPVTTGDSTSRREADSGRVMVAPVVRPPSNRQLVEHACEAVREKIVSAAPPQFRKFSDAEYTVHQLGNITFEVSGKLDIPNAFGVEPTKPFVVHLRLADRRTVRATFIEVDGEAIFGQRDKRSTF